MDPRTLSEASYTAAGETLAVKRAAKDMQADRDAAPQPRRPTVVIEPSRGFFALDLRALWEYRELLYFFVWRDIRVRYKQTAIGAAWAVLQPFLTMLIFLVVFGIFAKFPSGGMPYPIFAYTGIILWLYFSQAATYAAQSLVGDGALLKKVFFPRLLVPLAAVFRPLVDFFVAFLLLLAMMGWYGVAPTWNLLAVPAVLLFAIVTALAVGLWLAALNVRYRDVGHAVPFLIQVWMFASPVAYSIGLVPERWQILYSINPLVGVVEGFRWAVLGTPSPPLAGVGISVAAVLLLFAGGLVFFRRMERTMADIV
jgi:lipopolysaccharide transport system permease protein